MGKHKKEYNTRDKNLPVWATRIYEQLNKQGLNQCDLIKKACIPSSTFSEWLSPKKMRQPSINALRDMAEVLGVSTDYLLGADECTTPNNEEIYKMTGLSDLAIRRLKQAKKFVDKGKVSVEKKVTMCNYLLEHMNKSSFLEDLYHYLFGEFFFQGTNGEDILGANIIISRSTSGKESKTLVFNNIFSEAYLGVIQRELTRMKDSIDKSKSEQEKIEYKKWEEENKEEILKEHFETCEEAEKE